MKQIVIDIENEIHIHTYEYEKFDYADMKILSELKEWLFPEKEEEDNLPF